MFLVGEDFQKSCSNKTTPGEMNREHDGIVFLAKIKIEDAARLCRSGRWQESQQCCLQVLVYTHQLIGSHMTDVGVTVQMVEMLVEAGRLLNTMMDTRKAAQCFNTALCLLVTCPSRSQRKVPGLCAAFELLIHSYIHSHELDDAVAIVNNYRRWLLEFTHLADVQRTLANVLLELGLAQLQNSMCSGAVDLLEKARTHLLQLHAEDDSFCSPSLAKLLGALGYCYMCNSDDRATEYLDEAVQIWRHLQWPPEECEMIVSSVKYYVEAHLRDKTEFDGSICDEMLRLHRMFGSTDTTAPFTLVADAFTYLGNVAFHKDSEKKALSFFKQALTLYRNLPQMDTTRFEIERLLRFVGISSYNCRDFHQAAQSYLECLHSLENNQQPNVCKLSQVAECCASLGFTYSRLRDFDSMLVYYERALQLESRLAAEDLELIETNIGSLYHVKATNAENHGSMTTAATCYSLAEASFAKALRYSWKSFPFINYGYYLLCRNRYAQAVTTLQQGYLNGVIDKDTVEFDHTEDPILIDDLRFELDGREDIRMPSTIIALYLKSLCEARMGNVVDANHTVEQLGYETNHCKYESYFVENYGLDRMKALCFSLLGYAYAMLDCHVQALKAFEIALTIKPDYNAAMCNVARMRNILSNRGDPHR
ncbi:hypothetical protein LSAT2_006128 [Lamellibrachia satsuma]|nr:hypothetical protein LSAT2_006128 [Lamellibrachia satsuma]